MEVSVFVDCIFSIVVESISTIEKFAYISAHSLVKQELSTWMVELKLACIDDEVVEDP